ncbi:hypothetical protein [Sphingomonas sp. CFBP 8760]|uniref:hypothetical protein n=1 Tax=Sphingomonas sp. CFBP 8760 TaxID=2775282 RepID=UPI001A910503|nr:hypothetical protein [Sphingomonas sp. CFBP 8760]
MSDVADARRSETAPSALSFLLEEMSFKDAEQVGAIGTGCTWRGGPGMAQRMSIADDRGGIRRNGEVAALRPAADARPLFFTYDRWTDGATTIRIRDTGKVVRQGREFSETVAWLDFEDVRTRSFAGRLNCGS